MTRLTREPMAEESQASKQSQDISRHQNFTYGNQSTSPNSTTQLADRASRSAEVAKLENLQMKANASAQAVSLRKVSERFNVAPKGGQLPIRRQASPIIGQGETPVQMFSYSKTTAQANKNQLRTARRQVYPQGGVAEHNFAAVKGIPQSWAHSNAGGHSEAKASANGLAVLLGGDKEITVLTERAPCDDCQAALTDIETSSQNAVTVKANYLVENDNNAVDNLREVYNY